ncbi:MAG: histidinol-phosphatase, partial [Alphaproteobacteria bacterium]|nr:histidinol-phosphatase [Alphaproteobacteria bacterium]
MFLALALRLAEAAGNEIRPHFRNLATVEEKHDLTPVTVADRAAEAAMRALIETHFPDHGILGEEFGRVREDAEYVWVLDPID